MASTSPSGHDEQSCPDTLVGAFDASDDAAQEAEFDFVVDELRKNKELLHTLAELFKKGKQLTARPRLSPSSSLETVVPHERIPKKITKFKHLKTQPWLVHLTLKALDPEKFDQDTIDQIPNGSLLTCLMLCLRVWEETNLPHRDYPDLIFTENFIAAACQRYVILERPFKETLVADMLGDGLWALDPTTKNVRCTLDKSPTPVLADFGPYDLVEIDNKYNPTSEVKVDTAENSGWDLL